EYWLGPDTAPIPGISERPDIAITKTPDPIAAIDAETISWTITITNKGDRATDRIVVTDTLPVGYVIYSESLTDTVPTSIINDTGSGRPWILTWVIDDQIDSGATKVITVGGTVDCPPLKDLTPNEVYVAAGCSDGANGLQCVMSDTYDSSTPFWEANPAFFNINHEIPQILYCECDTITVHYSNAPNGVNAYGQIVLSDTLPSGLTFEGYQVTHFTQGVLTLSPDSAPLAGDTGFLSWYLPPSIDLNKGETITLSIAVCAACDFSGGQNAAMMTAETCYGETYSLPQTTKVISSSTDQPEFTLVKRPKPFAAESPNFEIVITNVGDTDVRNEDRVKVVDYLPGYLSYPGGATPAPYSVTGNTLTWIFDDPDSFPMGGSLTINLPANLICNYNDTPNRVVLEAGCDSGAEDFKCAYQIIEDTAVPYWKVAEIYPDSFSIIQSGANFGYCDTRVMTISFANDDRDTLHAPLIIADTLPAGIFFLGVTGEFNGVSDNPDTVPVAGSTGLIEFGYTTEDLDPGETLTLYITVSSDCTFSGPDTNTVSISGATCFGQRYTLTNGENKKGITGTTARPIMSVTKTPDPFPAEGEVTWTITVSNSGGATPSRTIVSDTLPAYMKYVSSSPGRDSGGDTFSKWVLDQTDGETMPFKITLVASVTPTDSLEPDTVCISTGCPHPSDTNNLICEYASTCDTSTPYWKPSEDESGDFDITKTPVGFIYCDTREMTVVFDNREETGDVTAYGQIILTDTMPAGLFYLSSSVIYADSTGATSPIVPDIKPVVEDTGTLKWYLPSSQKMHPGDSITLSLIVRSDCSFTGGTNHNSLTAHTAYGETYTLPLTGPDSTPLGGSIDRPTVTIQKLEDPFPADVEDTITWTITVRNTGPTQASRTIITDTLPAYITFDAAQTSPSPDYVTGAPGGEVLTWILDEEDTAGGVPGKRYWNGTTAFVITLAGKVTCVSNTDPNEVRLLTGCPDPTDPDALICLQGTAEDSATPYWVIGSKTGSYPTRKIDFIQTPSVFSRCDTLPMTITFINSDSLTMYGSMSPFIIQDTIPEGLYFANYSKTEMAITYNSTDIRPKVTSWPSAGDTGTLTWIISDTDLAPGDSISLTFNLGSVCDWTSATNVISITGHTCYNDTYSYSHSDTIPGVLPNLTVIKNMIDPAEVYPWFMARPDQVMTFEITITNIGTGPTDRVIVTDTLPPYLDLISCTPTADIVYDPDIPPDNGFTLSDTLVWVFDDFRGDTILANGDSITIWITAKCYCPDTFDYTNQIVTVQEGCPDFGDTFGFSCKYNDLMDTNKPYWKAQRGPSAFGIQQDIPTFGFCDVDTISITVVNKDQVTAYGHVPPDNPWMEIVDRIPPGLHYVTSQITHTDSNIHIYTEAMMVGDTGETHPLLGDGDTLTWRWYDEWGFKPGDTITIDIVVESDCSFNEN
ncbi:DUF11 domain-containing protein, partial [Patescibacteria group bacterium]|nr:DUF11 domain-containing protein [Patescibacteria group bacterium]